jgi:uncharacterized protein (TIGR00266 family)
MKATIHGDDVQLVHLALEAGDVIQAEPGTMMYMAGGVRMDTQAGGGGGGLMGGLMSGLKRMVAGESFFITTYSGPGEVSFAGPFPGKILALNLADTGEILCQRDSFMCGERGLNISIAFTKRLGAGLFGGEGFILQKLSGQGQVWLHAGGFIVEKTLAPGEVLRVDTGCLVAMTAGVDYDIQMVRGLKSMVFGGEGLFLTQLTGPGRVWLQSLPFSRLADRVMLASRGGQGESRGIAGVGGGLLGGLISGDD